MLILVALPTKAKSKYFIVRNVQLWFLYDLGKLHYTSKLVLALVCKSPSPQIEIKTASQKAQASKASLPFSVITADGYRGNLTESW